MENTLEETERPLLELMRSRSFKDWGEAPTYNEEYSRIRWPAGHIPETPFTNPVNGRLIRTSIPVWMFNLRYDISLKNRGLWNRNRSGAFSNIRRDTARVLMLDIRNCMRNNIPFKTRTYEYDPKTTTLYVGETGQIRYSLETGRICSFTYGGTYDKRMNLMLRRFSIYVVKKGRKLIYSHSVISEDLEIGLNDIIPVPENDPDRTHQIRELFYVQAHGSTTINTSLFGEYLNSQGRQVRNDRPASNLRQRPHNLYYPSRTVIDFNQSSTITFPPNITWREPRDSVLPLNNESETSVLVTRIQTNTGDTFEIPTVIQDPA